MTSLPHKVSQTTTSVCFRDCGAGTQHKLESGRKSPLRPALFFHISVSESRVWPAFPAGSSNSHFPRPTLHPRSWVSQPRFEVWGFMRGSPCSRGPPLLLPLLVQPSDLSCILVTLVERKAFHWALCCMGAVEWEGLIKQSPGLNASTLRPWPFWSTPCRVWLLTSEGDHPVSFQPWFKLPGLSVSTLLLSTAASSCCLPPSHCGRVTSETLKYGCYTAVLWLSLQQLTPSPNGSWSNTLKHGRHCWISSPAPACYAGRVTC